MAKIMLVEDDDNLREIYEARLLAEGYEIVSARDGEEALALAVKEKPDLIIADVMMPKISGFDMLDILRSTPATKDTKIIMMTALSQAEDKNRADKLGADRYLVKSQVTLEDVAKMTREVLDGITMPGNTVGPPSTVTLQGSPPPPTANDQPPINDQAIQVSTQTQATPQDDDSPLSAAPSSSNPITITSESPTAITSTAQSLVDEEGAVSRQIDEFVQNVDPSPPAIQPTEGQDTGAIPITVRQKTDNYSQPDSPTSATVTPVLTPPTPLQTTNTSPGAATTLLPPTKTTPESPSIGSTSTERVIQPINDLSQSGPDLNSLLEKEKAKEVISSPPADTILPPQPAVDNSSQSRPTASAPEHNDIAL